MNIYLILDYALTLFISQHDSQDQRKLFCALSCWLPPGANYEGVRETLLSQAEGYITVRGGGGAGPLGVGLPHTVSKGGVEGGSQGRGLHWDWLVGGAGGRGASGGRGGEHGGEHPVLDQGLDGGWGRRAEGRGRCGAKDMGEEALADPEVHPGGGDEEGRGLLGAGVEALPEAGDVLDRAAAEHQALGLVQFL